MKREMRKMTRIQAMIWSTGELVLHQDVPEAFDCSDHKDV